jgi:hypothetical protein
VGREGWDDVVVRVTACVHESKPKEALFWLFVGFRVFLCLRLFCFVGVWFLALAPGSVSCVCSGVERTLSEATTDDADAQ